MTWQWLTTLKASLRPSRRQQGRVLRDFERALLLIVDPSSLHSSITSRLREIAPRSRVAIFQRESGGRRYRASYSPGPGELEAESLELEIPAKSRLVRWLQVNETSLILRDAPEVLDYFEEAERDLLERLGADICVPLISLNRLSGFVVLGSPGQPASVSSYQRNLLQLLAGHAALALDNAALYERQRDRLRLLHRAERLATAGRLAAGVAHEIRNPLTAIRSSIQYLGQDLSLDGSKREMLDELLEEIDRIDQTVDNLLSLAKPRKFQPEELDLAALLEQSLLLVAAEARKKGIEIKGAPFDAKLPVKGDRNQLKELFINLLINALEAMGEGGRIRVSADRSGMAGAARHPQAEVRIADSGPGLDPEKQQFIFDPFFTTKSSGTGLGLALCHRVVQEHGGEIEIRNAAPRGVCAFVRLPLVD